MPKRILDVGQCPPDHAAICRMLEQQFDVVVVQAHLPADALDALRSEPFDLVLVNRKLDRDYSDGMEIIRQIKTDQQLGEIPCMLVTNFSEYQEAAVASGAEEGFGKSQLDDPQTFRRLERFLGPLVP